MNDQVLQEFLTQIKPVKGQIRQIYLFGSRARGDAKPYSDYDLLLVVKKRDRSLMDHLYEAVIDVLLSSGRLVSLKVFPETEFQRLARIPTPFMQRVLTEGKPVG